MLPITWPEFAPHPPVRAASSRPRGYVELITDLERMLAEITGYDAVSLQPNAGSQGEYAGLLAIRKYHAERGEAAPRGVPDPRVGARHQRGERGDGRAARRGREDRRERQRRPRRSRRRRRSSTPIGLCRADGHLPVDARRVRGAASPTSARSCTTTAGRCTSTARTSTRSSAWHSPGRFGADVSHMNLHKTFCIPHGGGGPGRRSGRGARAPRAVPAEPSAAARSRPGERCRRDQRGAVGLGRDPADLVGVHHDDGRVGPARRDAGRDPQRQLHRAPARAALPGALHRCARPRRARVHHRPAPDHRRTRASPSTTSPSGSSTTASTRRRCRSRSPAR